MTSSDKAAQAVLRGEAAAIGRLASRFIVPRRDNFVERPWGGMKIREFKRLHPLPEQAATTGLGLGEAFEIAAFAEDEEAARYASRVDLDDGSSLSLAELLRTRGREILGARFVAQHGNCFPLLPKTLDIKELLSVQGHPAGNTEAYIIIDADPGATLRLGFERDMQARALIAELTVGLDQQRQLLGLLGHACAPEALHRTLQPWLAIRGEPPAELTAQLHTVAARASDRLIAAELLNALKTRYWHVLDAMNVIPVRRGQVIHNATPARLLESVGGVPAAEVHALGNPEGREILVLEIRRPGPTFRAWDNVRFPMRDVDVEAAVAALNLRATGRSDFVVEPREVEGEPGVFVSIDSDFFRIEHLFPDSRRSVRVRAQQAHCLHVVRGAVRAETDDGRPLGDLLRGDSALVPDGIGAYTLISDESAEIVKVSLPEIQ